MVDLFHLPVGHLFSKAGSNAMFSAKRPNVARFVYLGLHSPLSLTTRTPEGGLPRSVLDRRGKPMKKQ